MSSLSISESKLTQLHQKLFSWLGSFWSKVYTDPKFISHIQFGRALRIAQLYLDFLENLKLNDRRNCPILHRERWYPIIIRKSEKNTGGLSVLRMDPNNRAVIGNQQDVIYAGTEFKIGDNIEYTGIETYPVHGKLDDVITCIVDNIIRPSVILRKGVDFVLGYNAIGIQEEFSPFNNNSFPKFELLDSSDTETVLWGCDMVVDKNYLNDHLSYVVGTWVDSTDLGKAIINSYWNTLNNDTPQYFSELIATLCNVPYIKEDGEIIDRLIQEGDRYSVVTNKNVYTFPYVPEYRSKVYIGSVFNRGEYLDTAIKIYPFITNVQHLDQFSEIGFKFEDFKKDIPRLSIPSSITGGRDYSFTWDDTNWPSDLHDIGKDDTISTAEYMLENVVGANTLFVVLNTDKISLDSPLFSVRYFKLLQKSVPAHIRMAMTSSVTIPSVPDKINLTNIAENITVSKRVGLTDVVRIAEIAPKTKFVPGCLRA